MPQIDTVAFGRLNYADDAVLDFPVGLPAFEDQKRFVLIERPDVAPLVFLQSLTRPELVFPALPVAAVVAGYEIDIPEEDRALLGPVAPQNLLCLAIVTLSGQSPPTANLAAPVVVNPILRRAVQAVQSTPRYSHRHPLPAPEDLPSCS